MVARVAIGLAAIAAAAVIYGWHLDTAPIYLTADEAIISLNAHAIATTGRDTHGTLLPLYFRIEEFRLKGAIWYQPTIVYAMAAILKFAPLTEWTVRLPALIVGVLDLVLMFWLVRALYGSVAVAASAALFLFLTPAHFMHSRFAMDYIFPIPYVLGWLLGLVYFERTRQPRWLFIATLCLGFGFYSYIAAVVLMSTYAAATLVYLWLTGARRADFRTAALGFALPLSAFVMWLAWHPTVIIETYNRYEFNNPHRLGPIDRLTTLWNYYSPSYLFFNGASEPLFSTRTTGVFAIPLAVLLPLGFLRALRSRRPFDRLVLIGFVTAPLAAILLDEGSAINRSIEVVPFGILLTAGVIHAWWKQPIARAAIVLMLLISVVEFRGLLVEYHGDYRLRTARVLEGDIQGAIVEILNRQPRERPQPVLLSTGMDLYWRFFTAKYGRDDLRPTATTFGSIDAQAVEPGTFVLMATHTPETTRAAEALIASASFTPLARIVEPDRTQSFVVLQRAAAARP
jgi:hypothetical protein